MESKTGCTKEMHGESETNEAGSSTDLHVTLSRAKSTGIHFHMDY